MPLPEVLLWQHLKLRPGVDNDVFYVDPAMMPLSEAKKMVEGHQQGSGRLIAHLLVQGWTRVAPPR
jgi:hypothetical protein